MPIEKESVQSLFLEMFFNESHLASGTGFVVQTSGCVALVTNRHNVTGRRQDNNKPLSPTGGVPNMIRVWRNAEEGIDCWIAIDYKLYDDDGIPLWIEHPTLGAAADFVAILMDTPPEVVDYPYSTATPANEIYVRASEIVSIIGFPFGQAAGGLFGVWVSGFVASEPDVNYNGLPQFLVDCRSRPGQSGSPVLAVRHGIANLKGGKIAMGVHLVELVGIYSGRITEQSDIGIVWKRSAIDELVSSINT